MWVWTVISFLIFKASGHNRNEQASEKSSQDEESRRKMGSGDQLHLHFVSVFCLFGWLEGKEEKIREGNDGAVEEIGGEYVYIIEIYRVEESEVNICR